MATKPADGKTAEAPAEAAGAAAGGGGAKSFLPLILNIVLMPVMAYVMTTFVLMPKLKGPAAHGDAPAEAPAHGGGSSGGGSAHGGGGGAGGGSAHGAKGGKGGKQKNTAPLGGKVLVNVSGTGGTRYLLGNFTLVSAHPDLKALVEGNDPQLRDVASGILANKTIQDLEKPGARTMIRTELISAFNNIFGSPLVEDIYFTEFAIQ